MSDHQGRGAPPGDPRYAPGQPFPAPGQPFPAPGQPFSGPGPQASGQPFPAWAPPPRPGRGVLIASAALATATAVLCVVAPLLRLYSIDYSYGGVDSGSQWVTGWTAHFAYSDSETDDFVPVRYGIPLLAAAVLLVVGSAGGLLRRVRPWVPSLAALGGVLTTGMACCVLLEVLAVRSNYSDSDESSLAVGAGGWLLFVAGPVGLAVATLGVLASTRLAAGAPTSAVQPAGGPSWGQDRGPGWGPGMGPGMAPQPAQSWAYPPQSQPWQPPPPAGAPRYGPPS